MLMIQAAAPETTMVPWWVLYIFVLALTWGTWKLARRTGWAIPLGCLSLVPLLVIGVLALPDRLFPLIMGLSLLPAAAAFIGIQRRRGTVSAGLPSGRTQGHHALQQIPPQLLAGQPRPEAVRKSKVMPSRFVAGLPRDAAFVARVRYVSGIGEMTARPVDLFLGGGQLWVAPLTTETPPFPIPARNVLRVDVWPELEAPPTLRVSWSPPAGELTAEVVLAAMHNVPPEVVVGQIQAVAGVLTQGIAAEAREAERAEVESMAPLPSPSVAGQRFCSNCGETVPPGATHCPRCATPV